jgi:hypothetical protein
VKADNCEQAIAETIKERQNEFKAVINTARKKILFRGLMGDIKWIE